jgi:chromate transport protein ChrA
VAPFPSPPPPRVLGLRGALAGVLAETAPSAVLAVLLTQGYETWRTNPWVMAGVGGTIAAVAAMMWSSIWYLVKPHLKNGANVFRALVITLGAFAAVWKFGLGPLPVIGIAVVLGLLWKEPA